ncbi:uncharacterized protein LOC111001501 [Pieris rapae]|uniref:uncharacterized protein LOC111001501 n=1 Tax=Pieris rapae TaxID=64459 RepID=UPI001E27F994|nr:uncharacterized protein LOC111001501 [Pieris rapae]
MPLKLIQFTLILDIIFLSAATTPWTIKSKYLLNKDIKTGKAIRKNNFHDYNFDDWEETTPLLYFDDTNDTMNKTIASSTPIHETESLVTDITTEGAINSEETTTVDDEAKSPETVAPSNTTVKDVLEHYLTTTEADIWTTNIQVINNSLSTMETQPTVDPLLLQVKAVMETHKFGYFTSLLIVFMWMVGSMDEKPIDPLKDAFYQEIQGAQSRGRLDMFGPLAEAVVLDIAEMIAQLPADQIKSQAAAYHVQYINRRSRFSPQTNAIFDVLDSAFESGDAMSVLSCFADIQAFPNVTKKAEHISRDLIEHVFYIPYSRIRGTAKDKILMLELENAIKNRMTGSVRRHQAKKTNPKQSRLRNGMASDSLQRNKTKINKYKKMSSKQQGSLRPNAKKEISKNDKNIRLIYYLFGDLGFDTTKLTSTTDVDLDYLRNKTIMAELKERMKLYKKKFRIIRKKENQTGIQRGKTTTTTTTTKKPKMRKSKYYIRKYVKKNLYKMKTTTPTTTTKSRWFRKWYQENTTESSSSHEIEGRMTSSIYINNRNVFNKRTTSYTPKTEWTKGDDQDITVKSKIVDLKLKMKGFRQITDNSDYSSYEDDFKANVRDAIMHGREHDLSLFKDKRRYDKVKSFQSYSNEEPIIKANVYKVFGYGNDFADRLKN